MFNITCKDIRNILNDYNISYKIKEILELQRYDYSQDNSISKEVRLIVKIVLDNMSPLVIRFKNEKDVTLELIESQCIFADILKKNGVITPMQYQSSGNFARRYNINGYDVIVTVEQFIENEIKTVDEAIAEKTGKLLAKTHSIAEQNNIHVNNEVLFNPFTHNDLFAYDEFMSLETSLKGENKLLFDRIVDKYNSYMDILSPLKNLP